MFRLKLFFPVLLFLLGSLCREGHAQSSCDCVWAYESGAYTVTSFNDPNRFQMIPETNDPLLFRVEFSSNPEDGVAKVFDYQASKLISRRRATEKTASGSIINTYDIPSVIANESYSLIVSRISYLDSPSVDYNLLPMETRPVQPLGVGQSVSVPLFAFAGDVRFYRFRLSQPSRVRFSIRGSDSLAGYVFNVLPGKLTAKPVASLKNITLPATATEMDLLTPVLSADTDYYLEAGNRVAGTRSLSFTFNDAPSSLAGDLNGDGKITLADVIRLLQSVVGTETLNQDESAIADVNGDGKIDLPDVLLLLRAMVEGSPG